MMESDSQSKVPVFFTRPLSTPSLSPNAPNPSSILTSRSLSAASTSATETEPNRSEEVAEVVSRVNSRGWETVASESRRDCSAIRAGSSAYFDLNELTSLESNIGITYSVLESLQHLVSSLLSLQFPSLFHFSPQSLLHFQALPTHSIHSTDWLTVRSDQECNTSGYELIPCQPSRDWDSGTAKTE